MKSVTHNLVDDLVRCTTPDQRATAIGILTATTMDRIGPLAEYAIQQKQFARWLPDVTELSQTDSTRAINNAISNRPMRQSTTLSPASVEFRSVPLGSAALTCPYWTAFGKRFERAAVAAGFSSSISAGLTGAMAELADNAVQHSCRPQSGLVGYRMAESEFEYVVVDEGIGVLRSLRKSPKYAYLSDSGHALRLALTDGVSRFPDGSGHGTGFRELFRNLRALGGFLRFRSGDHKLEIDGGQPELEDAVLSQTTWLKGFTVCVLFRGSSRLSA